MSDIPAARNALRILKFLAAKGRPTRAAHIGRDLGIPRSSTYHLLNVLLDEGFLVHFPEAREYGLSSLLTELGSLSPGSDTVQMLATPIIRRYTTREKLPVVAFVGVLHGTDIKYVAKEVGPRAPTVVGGVGIQLPAHLTATGRALLAGFSRRQILALYPNRESFFSRTKLGPGNFHDFTTILEETRQRGWALEASEIAEGLASVGAVATDHNEQPAAAIGFTFRTDDIPEARWPDLASAAIEMSGELSKRLTGST
ncbi:IclR family transcriptional regulator [Brevibacterium sp.]|uniref:IclR family transcriptional regulator n=1 Tax=Brevibacterium sp. TaxID=1701 RepID=UPI0028119102|nr:IclR family transcriptional regulator [Brevibacterium sp.]